MFRHINLSRLRLLLRLWWLERTGAILEDQLARVQVAIRENDLDLIRTSREIRNSIPEYPHLSEEFFNG